jgi:hypothetical protein
MKAIALITLLASCALTGCSDIEAFFGGDAIAYDEIGFTPSVDYPSRDTSYDGWLPEQSVVSEETLYTLFNHVAFPQSRSAIEGLLGYAIAEDGNVSYWDLNGGSELAIFFSEDQATHYTVGY